MASTTYLNRKRKAQSERNSIRGKYGNEVKAKLRMERGQGLEVVGWCETGGNLGCHRIELLACEDPTHVWIRIDGELRTPRTMRGFLSVMSRWFYNKGKENRNGKR